MDHTIAMKEHEFKAKLDAAPDRHALKLAHLTRALEMVSVEKECKVQEARDLHEHVNALVLENTRCTDRIKMLMTSARGLRAQCRNLERQHETVISQNRGLQRRLEKSLHEVANRDTRVVILENENAILKDHFHTLRTKWKITNLTRKINRKNHF